MCLGTSSKAFDNIMKFNLPFICVSIEPNAVGSTWTRAIQQRARDSMIICISKKNSSAMPNPVNTKF